MFGIPCIYMKEYLWWSFIYSGFARMPGGGTVGDLFVVESLVYSLFVVVVVDSLKTTIKGVDPLQFTSEYTKYIL